VKKAWIDALMQRTPKMMNSFQDMFSKVGGMKRPIAKLNNLIINYQEISLRKKGIVAYQFAIDSSAMPVARVSKDQTSAA
jgi:hypothetical protein